MISEFETCALTTSPTYLEECQRNFQYLQTLLFSIGVTEAIWIDVIKILSAILHLQRLVVSGSDAATISAATKNHVAYAESIFGLEQGTLGPTLLKRVVDMHGTKTFKNLSQEDATSAIFTLSSELYTRTFDYLLRQCNSHTPLQPPTPSGGTSVSIGGPILQLIDFSGNEIFPINNLSQLIVHMTEEKMNEYLIYRSFQREVEFLRSEGVGLIAPPIEKILDSEPILTLIEKPSISIFNLLEEACLLPRSNDNALLDKILSTHSKGKLIRTGGRQAKASCFIIKHNFGDVLYDIDGFINSNKSTIISNDMKTFIKNILCNKFPFLLTSQDQLKDDDDGAPTATVPGRRKIDKGFNKNLLYANVARDQLKLLIDSLHGSEVEGTADPLMIFCLRGSADIKSLTFDPSYTSSQLDFLNLSSLASFAKKGYAQRSVYKEFYDRYRVMFPYTFKDLPWRFPSSSSSSSSSSTSTSASSPASSMEGKNLCKHLLEECAILGCLPHLFADETIAPIFGNTFLFCHTRLIEILELLRSQILSKYSLATLLIQSLFRMKRFHQKYQLMKHAVLRIQTSYRCYQHSNHFQQLKRSISLIQTYYKMKLLRRRYQLMKRAIVLIESAYSYKKSFFKYKKIQRGLLSLHSLMRCYVLRQQINSIIRAILKLQSFAKDFLKRNHLFYHRHLAVVILQKVFRGSYVRYLNKPIVRALKIRKNQRIGTLAIKKLQSKFRMLRIYHRYHEILKAAKVIRSWTLARKQRKVYLQILYLTKWLQCLTRQVIAMNKVNNLRVIQMLQEEYQQMSRIRNKEMEMLNYSNPSSKLSFSSFSSSHSITKQQQSSSLSSQPAEGGRGTGGGGEGGRGRGRGRGEGGEDELLNLRIGGGYYRNAHDKFNRYVIGFDLNFDLSIAYPQGWIQTLIKFNQHLKQNGQKRLSHIAIGKNHTVLVDSTSGVYTFGLGDSGQLGHGNKMNQPYPCYLNTLQYQANVAEGGGGGGGGRGGGILSKSISSRVEVLSVCTGSDHTLLLTAVTKRVFSWGSNRRGQLGHSDFLNSSLPRLVLGPKNVRVIACGSYHSASLADPGILYLWGARECLGRKADSDCCEAQTIPFFQKKRVQQLVCGDIHVTVRAGSDFYSWGLNTHGQLGIGGDERSSNGVSGAGRDDVDHKGQEEEEEEEREEGDDDDSNLNDFNETSHRHTVKESIPMKSGKNSILPVPLSQSTHAFSSWTEADFLDCQLVAGGRHMLLTLRHRLWCWGWNKFGQVGNGQTINVLSPIEISLNGPKINSTTMATRETLRQSQTEQHVTQKISITASKIMSAIAGWRHSAVLTKGGVIYIWGLPQLHSSCDLHLPTEQTQPQQRQQQSPNESQLMATEGATPPAPLLVPHVITLPSSFSSLPTSSSHLTPILGLFSCSSSSFSMTALEVIEIDTTPINLIQKEKFQSSRRADTLQFHNTATVQREIKQRLRQELGPWSTSALKTNHSIAFTESSDVSVASSSSSMYNRRGWGGDKSQNKSNTLIKGHQLPLSSTTSSPSKTASHGATAGSSPATAAAMSSNSNRSCEGNVTEEGLLKLFSPLKTHQSSFSYSPSSDVNDNININDYFNIPNEDEDNQGTSSVTQRYRSERSKDGTGAGTRTGAMKNSNLSLSSLQRKRRSSIVAMLHPEDDEEHADRQSQRRASLIALQRVNEKNKINKQQQQEQHGNDKQRNNESSSVSSSTRTSKLDSEVNSLIQSARVRKESPTRSSRLSQSDNASTASAKRKKEAVKGSGPKYSEDFETANESSLSHIAVSDLATMIQSIKKESLQQMSMSWRV
jgi:alpha-tubulin suppressor-like RCC1 family protein